MKLKNKENGYSLLSAWALSFGCSVGWGAFVMPFSTLMPLAGPMGTIIALIVGMIFMAIVAYNFHIMMNCSPGTGSVYSFTKSIFGYDHSFLCVWATALAYLAVLWANASALALIVRYLFGNLLLWGGHYTISGYDVWTGEILATIVLILFFGFCCCKFKSAIHLLNVILAIVLFVGVVLLCSIVFCNGGTPIENFGEGFVSLGPKGEHSKFLQILNVVVFAPWAFVGFASVTFASSDYKFKHRSTFKILIISLVSATIVYVLLTLLAVSFIPSGIFGWEDYLSKAKELNGSIAVPVFYAVEKILGKGGMLLLGLCIMAGIFTSMIGLYRTMGRLLHTMAEDSVLPEWFAKINNKGIPQNAILFVMALSAIIPFIGRTAISWIVDITSISASIVYLYVSCGTVYLSKSIRGVKRIIFLVLGILGVLISSFFFFFPLMPSLWNMSILATESFMILVAWSIFGFFIFRAVFMQDKKNRFGKSTIMWMSMIFILLFSSVMWTREVTHEKTEDAVENISNYHFTTHEKMHAPLTNEIILNEKNFMESQMDSIRETQLWYGLMQFVLIMVSLFIMFNILRTQQNREKILGAAKIRAEESSKAKSIFLSNMSHDIRTPMNAIIGYTNLARQNDCSLEQIKGYLEKINSSNMYLLALINDVLEMSRIEIGKEQLEEKPCNLEQMMLDMKDMFEAQMKEKHIDFIVETFDVKNPQVLCDKNRLNRVMLNLVGNALKFTLEYGRVSVSLMQLGEQVGGFATYEIRVKDNGIGMSPEFAEHVFEVFERERESTISGIQGTGLGMAITKNILDLMGGKIRVNTEKGEGTEFIVELKFKVIDAEKIKIDLAHQIKAIENESNSDNIQIKSNKAHKKILLVEDIEVNRELAKMILENHGFEVEIAINGLEAVQKIESSEAKYFDVILMDIQMPVMDGYMATKKIRALPDKEKSSIPIIAMTANAFTEDIKRAKESGMNAHVAKPIDVENLMNVINSFI